MATAMSMAAKLGLDKSGWSKAIVSAAQEAAKLADAVSKAGQGATSAFSKLGDSIKHGVGKAFDWLKSQAADTGKVMLGVFGGNLLTGAAQGLVNTIRAVPAALMDMAESALPIANIGDAFQGITGDATSMLKTLREGSLGMVTDVELMKSYNSAAQLVGKEFADRLPDAMGYLSKVSAATGQDMGFMIDSLVKGVGRLSPMILDNLGIQVNATEANEAYAKSLGKSASELTKTEQQTAMMNMVLEKLAQNTAAMPAVAGTAAQSWAAMQTTFANLKDQIGMKLAPVLGEIAAALSEAFNRPEVQEMIGRLTDGLGGLAKQVGNVATLFLKGDIEGGLAKITDPDTAHGLIVIADALGKMRDALGKMRDALADLSAKSGGAQAVSQALKASYPFSTGEIIKNIGKVSGGLDNLKTIMAGVESGAIGTGQGISAALAVMFGVGDAGANAMQKVVAATQNAIATVSNYSMTTSTSALAQRTLANEAKYGADNVQSLAMNMGTARAAAEQFNTGAPMIAQNLQSIATAAQQSGQIMAAAFSSKAVQSSLATFQTTVAQFQATQLQQEQAAALQSEQAAFARNAQLLMAEAQYQQQRAMQVAQGEAQIAALQAAGQAKKAAAKQADLDADLANSDAKHQASVAMEEAQYQQQSQIQERALLVQRVQALQSYQAQLQDQQDAVLRALALAVQEATQKAGIEAESQKAVLDMIYGAGSAALQAEYGFAQDRLAIEQDLAEGRLTSAESQIKAILAVQEAEKGNAAAALQSAKAALAGFKIKAPALPPLDTSAFKASIPAAASAAGAAGAAASKPMAEKFTSALSTVNEAIDSAQNALVKLLGFELPAGWQGGLEKLKIFSKSMIAMLEETAKDITLKDAKTSEKIGKAMDRTMGAFAKFAQVTQIFAAQPINEAQIDGWLNQYHFVVGKILDAVAHLEASFGGYENIKNLYKTSKRFKTMLDSVLIELSAIKIVQLPDLNVWKQQIISVVTTAVQTVTELAAQLGGATGLKKAVANIGQIKSLIDLANSDLGGMKTSALPDLSSWKAQFLAVIRTVVEAVADAEVTIGAIPINRAAEIAPKLKTLVESVSVGLGAFAPVTLQAGETFEGRVTTYLNQVKFTLGLIVAWLYDVYVRADKMVGQAAEIAGPLSQVWAAVGPDLAKMVPQRADTFEANVRGYMTQIIMVGGLLVAWLGTFSVQAKAMILSASAAAKPVAELFAVLGVDLAKLVPQDAGTFEANARGYIGQLILVGGLIVAWLGKLSAEAVTMVKAAAEVAKPVAELFAVLGVDLAKLVPRDAGTFEANARGYMTQIIMAGGLLVAWLGTFSVQAKAMILSASAAAEPLSKVFGILSVGITAMVPAPPNFAALFAGFLGALDIGASQLVPFLRDLKAGPLGAALTEAAETSGLLKTIMDVLGLGQLFADLGDPKKAIGNNVEGLVTKVVSALTRSTAILVPALQSIQNQWGAALESVKAVAENMKAVFGGVSDAYKSAIEFSTGKTLNLSAFTAKLAQLNKAAGLVAPTPPAATATPSTPTGGGAAGNTATRPSAATPRMVTINLIINGILSDTFTGEMDDAGNVDVQLGNLMATA